MTAVEVDPHDEAAAAPSVLIDMPTPTPTPASNATQLAVPVSPQGRIQLYTDVEWEEFIREWATALPTSYVQIKRFGGTGDRGADVAAFKSDRGLEGPWDCFQGKHYADSLKFSDAAPEILKVFRAVNAGHWLLPDSYQFLAPRGCGTQLNQLLSQPEKLKAKFLAELHPDKPLIKSAKGLDAFELAAITALAATTDFALFKSIELLDVLGQHAKTPYHAARFAAALNNRPVHEGPPASVKPEETRYVEQLIEVYRERHPDKDIGHENISSTGTIHAHFQRQREAFYKAESLRLYARDSVPPGTFDLLQDDIYAGVVEIVADDHPSGWARLTGVLTHVGSLDLHQHTLIQVSDIEDRKGICHQLANSDRVQWVKLA